MKTKLAIEDVVRRQIKVRAAMKEAAKKLKDERKKPKST